MLTKIALKQRMLACILEILLPKPACFWKLKRERDQ